MRISDWSSDVCSSDLYWLRRYDWRVQEARLNRLAQFTAEVQGQRLHFIHAWGDGSRLPLMLIHGWPGSFLEFEQLIGPLVASGHAVIVPSLPGNAFLGRPSAAAGPRRRAGQVHTTPSDS